MYISSTDGQFPDGGGTKHWNYNENYQSVPDKGRGSALIRISSDSFLFTNQS